MKDVSSEAIRGVTGESLFLSVDLDIPRLTNPDFKYSVNDVVEKQPPHKYLKRDDDFRIYGNRHWNQQVFRFCPDGMILSERFPDMAINVVNEYLQLVDKKSVSSNWKWKMKRTAVESLYQLKHSHFEIDLFLIDLFNTNSNLTNNTHVTVDDIQPGFASDVTETMKINENDFMEIKQQNNTEIQTNIKQKKRESNDYKKNNTTMWILISVTVILIIIGIFIKTGCFPSRTTSNQNNNFGKTLDGNHNG